MVIKEEFTYRKIRADNLPYALAKITAIEIGNLSVTIWT